MLKKKKQIQYRIKKTYGQQRGKDKCFDTHQQNIGDDSLCKFNSWGRVASTNCTRRTFQRISQEETRWAGRCAKSPRLVPSEADLPGNPPRSSSLCPKAMDEWCGEKALAKWQLSGRRPALSPPRCGLYGTARFDWGKGRRPPPPQPPGWGGGRPPHPPPRGCRGFR